MGPIKFTLIKKLKSNDRFNYTPRYFKGKEEVQKEKHQTKFDAYADAYNSNDFSGNWNEARTSQRNSNNTELNVTVIVIAVILIFLFLWIIDFDLSIFS
jgi:flagellar basal body L-ring protein FlgH